jgi:YcaO-like protein with predicted kinase domain
MLCSPFIAEGVDQKLDLIGTARACTAAATLHRLRTLFIAFGITRVARVTGLDVIGIPTSVSIRPNARHLSTSQGKGITSELADVSAIMESIEGYHAETLSQPSISGSFRKLSSHRRVLDPSQLTPGMRWKAYSPNLAIHWCIGRDLGSGEPVLIPCICVTMDSSRHHPEFAILDATTNGLSAGNTPAEAICHGLFEVIERESEYQWMQLSVQKRNRRLVNLATIRTSFLTEMVARLRRSNLRLHVWDITTRLQIPAYRCVIEDFDPWRGLGRFHGSGAHLSKEIALSRAITEAAQSRLTWIHGAREDVYPSFYEEQPRLAFAPITVSVPSVDFEARSCPFWGTTLDQDLDWIVRHLRRHGYSQVIVFDHTRPEFGVPVVLVIVPGMRFSGNRF